MAHGPKSKKRLARVRLAANQLAQSAGYLGAADASRHARQHGRRGRRSHCLADVYAVCEKAGYG
jgi:hypothetical protein